MKDFTQTSVSLDKTLRAFFTKFDSTKTMNQIRGRSSVSIVPKTPLEELEGIRIRKYNFNFLIFLLLYSYYGNIPEIQWNLRLELERLCEVNEEFFFVKTLTEDKFYLLQWLIQTQRIHSREFFGNILNISIMEEKFKTLKFIFPTKKRPVRQQRVRGYRDKGTLPSFDTKFSRKEFSKDWSSKELQNEIEDKRKSLLDTGQLLLGWLS